MNREVTSRHTPAVVGMQVAFNKVCGKLITSPVTKVTKSASVLSYLNIGLKSAVRCYCNMVIDLPKLIIVPPESGRARDASKPILSIPVRYVPAILIIKVTKPAVPFTPSCPSHLYWQLVTPQQALSQRETCGRKKLRERIVLNKSPLLQSLKGQ